MRIHSGIVALAGIAAIPTGAHATVQVRVTATNLAPTNSISFAPLRVGFHSGVYDAFNNGETATAPIISIAEGGSGSAWFPAFAAADPSATLGAVVSSPAGPLLPGATASAVFTIDPLLNPYFTFAAMAVPSNDHFIGNDSPTQHRLFNAQGQLVLTSISQRARDIWDAGSEVNGVFGAAFLPGSNNDDRIAENGVVTFDFAGLGIYNGLTTAAGYVFGSQLSANTDVYRITFEIVPAPGSAAVTAMAALAFARRRRRA